MAAINGPALKNCQLLSFKQNLSFSGPQLPKFVNAGRLSRRESLHRVAASPPCSAVAASNSHVGETAAAKRVAEPVDAGAGSSPVSVADTGKAAFLAAASEGNVVPLFQRIFGDHLTPVLAYRCLVKEDERDAPSFLFESVEATMDGNRRSGRYSYVGAQPALEVVARGTAPVSVLNHSKGERHQVDSSDPLAVVQEISAQWRPVMREDLPEGFCGGWVGYTSYDTVRYVESKKIPFSTAPHDDRHLPDLHLSLYNDVVVFDHVTKIVFAVCWVHTEDYDSLHAAHEDGMARLHSLVDRLKPTSAPILPAGSVTLDMKTRGRPAGACNMTREQFEGAVLEAKEHILAGDIFQIVLSQRFERRTFADPFEVYRALRVVNPSPYLSYIQTRGSILVASSPEILCRITDRTVVNRPLAGTRPRGRTVEEDQQLEQQLLADQKEVAEHVMLVDLGRNDVGKVSIAGSVRVDRLMNIERYSHVMHISSTVTGTLLPPLTCWDALRAALPVGTVSGAPKVKAMELIDKLEPTRRGPYAGGIGYVSFSGSMDFALALRTMVFPTSSSARSDTLYTYGRGKGGSGDARHGGRQEWVVQLQAGAGIVADSNPASEYEETVNKAAALGRAIDLAESSFVEPEGRV